MNKEEEKEFLQLKKTLCKYGFLTSPEEMRFNELFDKNLASFKTKMSKFLSVQKQIDEN